MSGNNRGTPRNLTKIPTTHTIRGMNNWYQDRPEAFQFDKRFADAMREGVEIGDHLKGSWPSGAALRLPSSGDGGEVLDYARQGHVGGKRIEHVLAALEMGKHALCFSDGMQAISAATRSIMRPGDTVFVHEASYGGSLRYFNNFKDWGITVQFLDLNSDEAATAALEKTPKLFFAETVTNPTLEMLDQAKLFNLAKRVGAAVLLDNTLPTSFGCVPLDIARHCEFSDLIVALSLTKGYTGGVLSGALITDSDEFAMALYKHRQREGGNLAVETAPIAYAGLDNMNLRMERLSSSALALARYFIDEQPLQIKTHYPYLGTGEPLRLSREYLLRPPGVVTIECEMSPETYREFTSRVEQDNFRANSFNGSRATISESALQSHGHLQNDAQRHAAKADRNLIRISPGTHMSTGDVVHSMRKICEQVESQKVIG